MSEEKVEMPVEEQGAEQVEAPAETEETKSNVASELQELGRQLTAATKAALESPEAQELGAQLHRGLESLGKTVNQLVVQVRESKIGQTVEGGVSDAATSVKDRRIFETLAESVTTALSTVNQALGQAVEKAQVRAEEAKMKRSAPQQIAVVGAGEEEPAEPEVAEE